MFTSIKERVNKPKKGSLGLVIVIIFMITTLVAVTSQLVAGTRLNQKKIIEKTADTYLDYSALEIAVHNTINELDGQQLEKLDLVNIESDVNGQVKVSLPDSEQIDISENILNSGTVHIKYNSTSNKKPVAVIRNISLRVEEVKDEKGTLIEIKHFIECGGCTVGRMISNV